MTREKHLSGVETSFKDKNGGPICVHSYVKDDDGNKYYINSHCQAVPDGGDAPAIELARLAETTGLTVMTAEEVLNMSHLEIKRRRGRRNSSSIIPAESSSPEKKETEQKEEEAKGNDCLSPVTMQMVLSVIPDDLLATELRRRGYTICAVKPALLTI